jgi:hypothetical protein
VSNCCIIKNLLPSNRKRFTEPVPRSPLSNGSIRHSMVRGQVGDTHSPSLFGNIEAKRSSEWHMREYYDKSTHCWITQQKLHKSVGMSPRIRDMQRWRHTAPEIGEAGLLHAVSSRGRLKTVPCLARPRCTAAFPRQRSVNRLSRTNPHTTVGGVLMVRRPATASETTQWPLLRYR